MDCRSLVPAAEPISMVRRPVMCAMSYGTTRNRSWPVIVRMTISACTVLSIGVSTAGAQDARGPRAQRTPAVPALAELQRLFDAYVLVQAEEQLQLNDQQYPQFLSRVRTLQEVRRGNQQQRNRLVLELQRLSVGRGKGSDSAIKVRLKALQELEVRSAEEVRKAYEAVDEVLDLRQQARFRVLEEQMERRKLELLTRARGANRPGRADAEPSR